MALPVVAVSLLARLAPLFLKAALKYWLIGALVLSGVAWFGVQQYKAYSKGKAVIIDRVNVETRKVEDAWAKIDREPRSVDDALGSLRKRARGR